jgi:diguanylate cyclase (GGDEF)-like protein
LIGTSAAGIKTPMNFRNGDTLSTVKRDLRGAILGTSVSLAGSAALLLILNLIMPANPFLGGLIATSVISIVVVFPLLLSMRRKDGELRKMQARLNHAARHDTVTNTLNGSVLAAAVEHYIDRRKTIATDPGGILVAVIVQELDAISRRYGPQWGDSIMQSLAGIVQSSIRRGDLVARLASNELSIFLPGATAENAEEIGKRIQQKLAENTFSAAETPLSINVKLGGAALEELSDFNKIRQRAGEMALTFGGKDHKKLPLFSRAGSSNR